MPKQPNLSMDEALSKADPLSKAIYDYYKKNSTKLSPKINMDNPKKVCPLTEIRFYSLLKICLPLVDVSIDEYLTYVQYKPETH